MDKRINNLKKKYFEFNVGFACKTSVKEAIVFKCILDLTLNDIEVTFANICEYLDFLTPRVIEENINKLKQKKYIENKKWIAEDLMECVMDDKIKNKLCEWCGNPSIVLQKHHYPIPKSAGGTKTVNICPNCHYGFHYLENQLMVVK